jgi:hypothetical protein
MRVFQHIEQNGAHCMGESRSASKVMNGQFIIRIEGDEWAIHNSHRGLGRFIIRIKGDA